MLSTSSVEWTKLRRNNWSFILENLALSSAGLQVLMPISIWRFSPTAMSKKINFWKCFMSFLRRSINKEIEDHLEEKFCLNWSWLLRLRLSQSKSAKEVVRISILTSLSITFWGLSTRISFEYMLEYDGLKILVYLWNCGESQLDWFIKRHCRLMLLFWCSFTIWSSSKK